MSKSENGWEPLHAGPDILNWVRVPGAEHVSLQFMKGWPTTILRAFAADFHAYIEPLRDADSAAFTPTNSVKTSNHLNGTAMDLNWNGADGRTFRLGISKERAYPGDRARNLDELLGFYEGMVFCGGYWSIRDWMHFQMGGNTWMNPRTQDFINRKIRSDGFSTYKRSGTPAPPAPQPPQLSKADQYALAVMAEGRRRGITPRGIQIAFSVVYVESNWKMYANSKVPESLRLPHDAVGSDHDSVGLFQQRCPMWGPAEVLMDPTKSAGLFYDRLAKMNYNDPSRQPGDFAADVQRPAAQYRGRYQERMGDAVALYNRLSNTPAQGDDELSAEAEAAIRRIEQKLNALDREYSPDRRSPTRSFFGESEHGIETPLGFLWNIDANVWNLELTWGYLLGTRRAEEFVNRVAQSGVAPDSWAGKLTDAQGHWLAQFGQEWCQGLIGLRAAMQKAFKGQPAQAVQAIQAAVEPQVVYRDNPADAGLREEVTRLRDENTRLQQTAMAVYEPSTTQSRTSGQSAGQVIDAVEDFINRATEMNPQQLEALTRALSVLQLSQSNGSKK